MRSFFILLSAFLLLPLTLLAQQGWFEQTSGTSVFLRSVHFTDYNYGWAVGDSGTILKTTNGGDIWTSQASGTTELLWSVHFTNQNNGWVVGGHMWYNGIMLNTTDGGINWTVQTSGTDSSLYSVYFLDSNTGWVGGFDGTILKTTDGGINWSFQTSGVTNRLHSIHFIDNSNGWIAGYGGTILKTTDGGENWFSQTSGTGRNLTSIHFTDQNNGWTVGGHAFNTGIMLNTTDGGTNWNSKTYGSDYDLFSVFFIDPYIGWISGEGGIILKTTDSGTNWTTQTSGTVSLLYSVHFLDSNIGWAVGNDGTILKTTTGGVIPVELTSFTASTFQGKVKLNWSTATEVNNLGFEVERKIIKVEGEGEWTIIGFSEGYGTTSKPQNYSYVDDISSVAAQSLSYRLKQIDYDGSFEYSDVVFVDKFTPTEFTLFQNFPNPWNPTTTIEYNLPVKSKVELVVYNSLGQKVKQLVNEVKEAGKYTIELNASNLPSGIYFYRLQAENFVETKKMILVK